MKLVLPTMVAVIVVAAGTYYQGQLSERWSLQNSEELDSFTARLDGIPERIGGWVSTDEPIDQEQFKASRCTGCVSRRYRNERNDDMVSVYLVSGTGRNVTIHSPDQCYVAAGYLMDNNKRQFTIDIESSDQHPEFLTSLFTKETKMGAERLRIFWTYSSDGAWKGPKDPKRMFGVEPAMYKIYFITPAVKGKTRPNDSPTIEFAQRFFPVANEVLFPADTASSEPGEESTAQL